MDRTPINHAALRRLTLAQLLALAKSPEAPARSIRLYRAWDAPMLIFEGIHALYVEGAERDKPRAITISIKSPADWAEYLIWHHDPRTLCDAGTDGLMLVEDYALEVYAENGEGARYESRANPNADDYLIWDARSIREARYHGIDAPQLHARAAR